MASASITIAVADPHPVIRAGIRSFCEAQAALRVVGECENGPELIHLIAALRPQYAIVDAGIPGKRFEDLISQVAAANAGTRILIHGLSRNAALIRSMLRAGVSGYVLKDGPSEQLIEALMQIRRGGLYVTPLIDLSSEDESETADPRTILSEREYQIFLGLGAGERPKNIAISLGLSPKTVDTYRANILRKLNLAGMAALVRCAARLPGK